MGADKEVRERMNLASFAVAWELLRPNERKNFWEFAAAEVQSFRPPKGPPRADSSIYDGLCAAISDVDRGARGKTSVVGLPKAPKRLSSDELQKAVRRLKDKLIGAPYAQDFLITAYCRWVQAAKLKTLLPVLDAFGCKHNDVGTLVGSVPNITPEQAYTAILPLARQSQAHDVRVVCAALALCMDAWAPVWDCIERLGELESQQPPNSAASTPSVSQDPLSFPAPSEPARASVDLDDLRRRLESLASSLEVAVQELRRGTCAELGDLVMEWGNLERDFLQLGNELGMPSRSIADLAKARDAAKTSDGVREFLTRLLTLEHKTDPSYTAHLSAVEDARRSLELIEKGDYAAAAALLPPLRALLVLVEGGSGLDETEASTNDELVRSVYGARMAVSAQRGTLALRAQAAQNKGNSIAAASLASQPEADRPHGSLASGALTSPVPPEAATAEEIRATASGEASDPVAAPSGERATDIPPRAQHDDGEIGEPGKHENLTSRRAEGVEATADQHPEHGIPLGSTGYEASAGSSKPARESENLPFTNSIEEFRDRTWISTAGRVEAAPWTQDSFAERLVEAAATELHTGRYAVALVLARAAIELDTIKPFDLDDFYAGERLLEHPEDLPSLREPKRAIYLRGALTVAEVNPDVVALALTLEAIAPNLPAAWSTEEIHTLISKAEFGSHALEAVLAFHLSEWAQAGDPLFAVKNSIVRAEAKPEELAQVLRKAQADLQQVVATLWNAAGGRIVHTHCKRAWMTFVRDHVAPLRDTLVPTSNPGKAADLPADQAYLRVTELAKAFQAIMNEGNVRHHDRVTAQTAAEMIVRAVEKVVEAKRHIEAKKRHSGLSIGALPVQEVRQLQAELPSSARDRLCVLLLRAAWTGKRQDRNPLRLASGYLREFPDLARAVRPDIWSKDVSKGIPVAGISDARLACALLLDHSSEPAAFTDRASALAYLREYAVENDRGDILAAIVPAGILQSHEKTQLHRRALDLGDTAFEATRNLERISVACDDLLAPEAEGLRRLVERAYQACSFAAGDAPIAETMILQAWIASGTIAAEEARSRIANVRLSEAQRNPRGISQQFAALIGAGDFRSAMALLTSDQPPPNELDESPRRTMWRDEAVTRFPNPRTTLLSELRGATSEQSSLVTWWVSPGENDQTYRDTLRKALYNVVSGEAGHSQEVNKRRFGRLTDLRDHKDRKTVIQCATLREYFRNAKLNPTFLPQLVDFDQIILASLQTSAQAGNAVDAYIRAAAVEGPRSLCVFLEPNVSAIRRDEIAAGLRRRQVSAVILDDIDICRLCLIGAEAEAHNFIPFFEIVFEQLDLEVVSPFSTLDGQHIRLESFVGRTQSADTIAKTWEYSRLFSGRKLGKSAFLRYVASTYDGLRLSTGKDLRIVFISIAGGSSETWVVDTIINEMTHRFNLWPEPQSSALKDPVERFVLYSRRFAEARKNDNVLIILDEADAFIEEQLRSYDQVRERSLSFYMMKRMPEADGSDMPRIRFLLAGYRVTNTRGGVWANAGDVLILKPLTEDEAVHFLHGMLGRVGVDVGNHAPFAARRCGYQPAVLIRFGESLLRRIRRASRYAREHYVVTHDDVIATMADQAVMEEIRTVVNNNFQGNRVSAAVFSATLLALKDLEPGMALREAPERVLSKLRSIDEDISWLADQGADPLAQIERQLQEFIERELLTTSDQPRFGAREYRLRFPHFMPVLAQQDLALGIRQHIQALRSGPGPSKVVESVLTDTSLDAIRYVFRDATTDECALAIAAGHWHEALCDDKVGVPDRLGCNPRAVAHCSSVEAAQAALKTHKVFANVTSAMWPHFLSLRPTAPLVLIGGIDLLRVALKRQLEGSDFSVDVRPFGPMSLATLSWWFEDARALHFKTADAVQQIFNATGGIPLLVGELSRDLQHDPATDVSVTDLQKALERFADRMDGMAELLAFGPAHTVLSERELQLLLMASRVAREVEREFDLQQDFPIAWELCASGSSLGPFRDEADRLSLQLLLSVGLLPGVEGASLSTNAPLGRVRFAEDGPLPRLLVALERVSAR